MGSHKSGGKKRDKEKHKKHKHKHKSGGSKKSKKASKREHRSGDSGSSGSSSDTSSSGGAPAAAAQLERDRAAVRAARALLAAHPAAARDLRQLLWAVDNGKAVSVAGLADEGLRTGLEALLGLLGLKCAKVRGRRRGCSGVWSGSGQWGMGRQRRGHV
jgi:hypothetical protein